MNTRAMMISLRATGHAGLREETQARRPDTTRAGTTGYGLGCSAAAPQPGSRHVPESAMPSEGAHTVLSASSTSIYSYACPQAEPQVADVVGHRAERLDDHVRVDVRVG